MRRTLAAGTVAVLTALLVLGGAAPASASTFTPPPVADIPDIPSNTIRMTQTGSGSWTASDWWKYVGWKIQQPGTTVATIPQTGKTVAVVPKPITPPTSLARAAGAQPLIGSFLGGFAIGTAGLELYGTITGTDPLQNLCGSAFEGAGSIMYMGTMPDCQAEIDEAMRNADASAGQSASLGAYGGFTFKPRTVQNTKDIDKSCWKGPSVQLPAGHQYRVIYVSAGVGGAGWATAPAGNAPTPCAPYPSYVLRADYAVASFQVFRQADGAVLASGAVVTTTGDPSRSPSCTIGWKDGTTTTGVGTTYRESQGLPISTAGLGCKSAWDAKPGAGREVMPDRIGVESTDDAGAKTDIVKQDVPEFSPTEKIALDPTLGNGRGLVLERVIDGTPRSCMDWSADCAQWWESTSQGTTEGPYRCTYGGAPLSIGECGPYRYTFDQRTAAPTVTDPSTGQQTQWQTAPQPGNSLNPGTGPGTGNNPGGDCFAAGWASMNPIEWVLTPVKCALVWAFVPRTSVVTAAQINTQAAWLGSTPGKLSVAIAGISASLGSLGDTSCGGLILPVPKIGAGWSVSTENRAFLAACPGDFFAPWAGGFYWFISLALVFGGIYAVKRLLDRFVGM